MMHMTQRKNEQGSAHVIIVTAIVAAVIAALAIVFWQNFINDKAANNNGSSVQTAEVEMASRDQVTLKTATIDEDFGTTLRFEYPEDWTYDQSISGIRAENRRQDIDLLSPTGKYKVTYSIVQGGGLGAMCDEGSGNKIGSFEYKILDGFSEMSFVKYKIDTKEVVNYDTASIGTLFKTELAESIKAGDSECRIILGGYHQLTEGESDSPVSILSASIEDTGADATIDIDTAILDQEYSEAKEILLSTAR